MRKQQEEEKKKNEEERKKHQEEIKKNQEEARKKEEEWKKKKEQWDAEDYARETGGAIKVGLKKEEGYLYDNQLNMPRVEIYNYNTLFNMDHKYQNGETKSNNLSHYEVKKDNSVFVNQFFDKDKLSQLNLALPSQLTTQNAKDIFSRYVRGKNTANIFREFADNLIGKDAYIKIKNDIETRRKKAERDKDEFIREVNKMIATIEQNGAKFMDHDKNAEGLKDKTPEQITQGLLQYYRDMINIVILAYSTNIEGAKFYMQNMQKVTCYFEKIAD